MGCKERQASATKATLTAKGDVIEFVGFVRSCALVFAPCGQSRAGLLGAPEGSPWQGASFRFVSGTGERGRLWVFIHCSVEKMRTLIGSHNEVTQKNDFPSSFSLRSPRAWWCRKAVWHCPGQGVKVWAPRHRTQEGTWGTFQGEKCSSVSCRRGSEESHAHVTYPGPPIYLLCVHYIYHQLENGGQISFWPATG